MKINIFLFLIILSVLFGVAAKPTYATVPGIKNFTISAWINPTSSITSKAIVVKNNEIRLVTDSSGHLICQYYSGGWRTPIVSSTTLTTGSWQHVACTYTYIDTTLSVFINGILSSSQSINQGGAGTSTHWHFGSDESSSYADFSGKMDEVRIYNRALSPGEVQSLYNWAPGPVGYWKLDENTGTIVSDSSGNGNYGTWTGSGNYWGTGKVGSAGQFNGSNDTISIGYPASGILDFGTNSFTYSLWYYPSQSLDGYDTPIWKGGSSAGNPGYDMELGTGHWEGNLSDGSSTKNTRLGEETLNQWVFLSVVVDRTNNKLSGYNNGQKVLVDTDITGFGSVSNTQDLFFSRNTHLIKGKIDEIKIYNYARTPSQIVEDMNAGHPAPGSPIGSALGWWNFDEGYGNVAYNSGSSGSTADGTLSGTSLPVWTQNGKFGKALSFSTSANNSVNLTNSASVKGMSAFTYSAWVNPASLPSSTNNYDIIAEPVADSVNYLRAQIELGNNVNNCAATSFNLLFRVGDSTSTKYSVCGRSTPVIGNWYHVVGVFDSTIGIHKLYINGQEEASLSQSVTAIANTDPNVVTRIGTYANGNSRWNGYIDEVKIFGFALTSDQVKLLYNQGQVAVMGAVSTDSNGTTASFSDSRKYCPPGDTGTCNPPVAEWNFNENTGQYIQDTSGNGLSGTRGSNSSIDTNDPAWTNAKNGSGLNFDGSDDYTRVNDNDLLTPANNMTMSLWFKIDTLPSIAGRSFYLASKNNNALPWQSYYCVVANPTNQIICYWTDSSDTVTSDTYTSFTIQANIWYYLTFIRDGGNLKIYINNQPDLNDPAVSGTLKNSNLALDFGGNVGSNQSWLDGTISQVKLYDYARTPAQIAWDYNKGGPIAEYNFDECSGSTLYDHAPKADRNSTKYNGTINASTSGQLSVGDCSTNANTMWYNGRNGKYSSSLNFDGTDDYVNIAENDILDIQSEFSVSAWVNRETENTNDIILAKDNDYTTGTEGGYVLTISSSDNARFYVSDNLGSACTIFGTSLIDTPGWHHIAATFINSGNPSTAKIYVDGVLENDRATGCYMSTNVSNALNLHIGSESDGGYPFDGLIDDVKIFNYALTPEQIKLEYNQGSAVSFR